MPGSTADRSSDAAVPEVVTAAPEAPASVADRRSPRAGLGRWLGGLRQSAAGRGAPGFLFYRAVLACLGLYGLVLAVPATFGELYNTIGGYDEGLLLTGAHLLLRGEFPYRDFYSNYPPGIFALLAGLFALAGPSVAVERLLGAALHLLIAGLAGRVAGRLLGQRFSLVVASLVACWLVLVGMPAYAWLAGLALALLACEAWASAQARGRPFGYALVGVNLGALSVFRHDLFIYFTLVLGGLAVGFIATRLWRGQRKGLFAAGSPLHGAPIIVLAAAGVTALLWLPVFGLAGIERVTHDLYFDQVRYTMPARVLPLPRLFGLNTMEGVPIRLPNFLLGPLPAAVLLTLAGPVLALAALLWPRGAGLKDRAPLIWPAALSLAVVPQMMGRTDLWHAVFTVAPSLLLSALWLFGGPERRWHAGRAWSLAALGGVLLVLPIVENFRSRPSPPAVSARADLARASQTPVSRPRQRAIQFIRKHTGESDPIYVGLTDHRWTLKSDPDLYFLSDRRGATRYLQFDPGLNDREDVQRSMIEELERTQPKVAILVERKVRRHEPNRSREKGSALLDQYLRRHYEVQGRDGNLRMLLRKPAPAPAGTP